MRVQTSRSANVSNVTKLIRVIQVGENINKINWRENV